MKEVTKDELRTIQLDMVAYIDQICRKNNIAYSISAGTLLGAIKYQGYIPWDDDIDLMLTRPNYNKLMEVLMQECPEKYSLLYYKVHEAYLPMAKLYDNRTSVTSVLDTLNQTSGIFIDIFPLDSLPDDKAEGETFKKQIRKEVTHLTASAPHGLSYASSEKWEYFIGKLILWFPYHIHYFGKYRTLAEKVDNLMQKYNDKDTKYCNYVFSPPKRTAYFDKNLFTEYEDIPFEQLTLRKIKNHAPYLSELYGDYMQPPRKNQQRNHDYYHWYWKDENNIPSSSSEND
ncbi:phosphorylcholine transferase LicD [Lactococcus nasutitermitis]|uniref:Phosphorylcholine transferase LicD n=1 Tax=Lactococcus nasutitermitis TaxID=1652957 RepID=A0ABV9JCH5_9LACT|nr:LicD family protein [Lactococcus nasutitermitis]